MFEMRITFGDLVTTLGFILTVLFAYGRFAERLARLETKLEEWIKGHEDVHKEFQRVCDERHKWTTPP